MEPVSSATVGRRIRKLRLTRGLSQLQLAQGICTSAYISTIESGKRRGSDRVLAAIADRLETTVDHLQTGRSPGLATRLHLEVERLRVAVIQGRPDEAVVPAEEIRDEALRSGLPSQAGRAEEVRGRALLRLGRRPEALEAFVGANEILREDPVEARAGAIAGAARCRFQMGDVHHAIHELEAYLIELMRRPALDPTAATQVYGALIGPCFEAGLIDRAREAAAEVRRLEARVTDPETIACSHINVGGVYLAEGRVEEAVAALARAETLFVQIGAVADGVKVAINQAMVFIEGERWEDARVRLKQALVWLGEDPNSIDRGRALNQLGRVERLSGDGRSAVAYLQEALTVLDGDQHNERGLAQRELGLCALAQGDVEAGTCLLRDALGSYQSASNPLEEARTYMLLGDAMRGAEVLGPVAQAYRDGVERATQAAL